MVCIFYQNSEKGGLFKICKCLRKYKNTLNDDIFTIWNGTQILPNTGGRGHPGLASMKVKTSIQLKLKIVVGVCNYVIFLANIFR